VRKGTGRAQKTQEKERGPYKVVSIVIIPISVGMVPLRSVEVMSLQEKIFIILIPLLFSSGRQEDSQGNSGSEQANFGGNSPGNRIGHEGSGQQGC